MNIKFFNKFRALIRRAKAFFAFGKADDGQEDCHVELEISPSEQAMIDQRLREHTMMLSFLVEHMPRVSLDEVTVPDMIDIVAARIKATNELVEILELKKLLLEGRVAELEDSLSVSRGREDRASQEIEKLEEKLKELKEELKDANDSVNMLEEKIESDESDILKALPFYIDEIAQIPPEKMKEAVEILIEGLHNSEKLISPVRFATMILHLRPTSKG